MIIHPGITADAVKLAATLAAFVEAYQTDKGFKKAINALEGKLQEVADAEKELAVRAAEIKKSERSARGKLGNAENRLVEATDRGTAVGAGEEDLKARKEAFDKERDAALLDIWDKNQKLVSDLEQLRIDQLSLKRDARALENKSTKLETQQAELARRGEAAAKLAQEMGAS